ncbi:hypothetical protein DBR42_10420, partial [Pelomonas sp. HMWF004]
MQVKRLADVARYRRDLSAGFFDPEPLLAQAGTHPEQAKDIAGAWEIREQGLADPLLAQPFEYANEGAAYLAFSRARDNAEARAAM